jgi:hypothetical protein
MRVSEAGFGGVVFGNRLTGLADKKPLQLIWVADPSKEDSNWGHFDVVLVGGTVEMTRRMRQDEAFAAWEIVNGRSSKFPPLDLALEEGVGLASVVRGRVGWNEPDMLVHPALYGLELGNAAVMADAIGFKMGTEAFKRHLSAAVSSRLRSKKQQSGVT